jgi:hypothetical protein
VRLGSPAKGHRRRACARRRISRGLLLLLRSTIVGTILAARRRVEGLDGFRRVNSYKSLIGFHF